MQGVRRRSSLHIKDEPININVPKRISLAIDTKSETSSSSDRSCADGPIVKIEKLSQKSSRFSLGSVKSKKSQHLSMPKPKKSNNPFSSALQLIHMLKNQSKGNAVDGSSDHSSSKDKSLHTRSKQSTPQQAASTEYLDTSNLMVNRKISPGNGRR